LPDSGLSLVEENGIVPITDANFFSKPVNSGFYTYPGEVSDSQFLLFSQLNSTVVGASVLPALGARTILSTLPSVQDRMHAPHLSVTGTGHATTNGGMWGQGESGPQKGIWARLFGGSNKFRSDSADNGFDTSFWAVQAGYDLMAKNDGNGGRSYAGLYLAYGNSNGDAQLNGHDVGDIELNATSVGAYWTKYTPNDVYFSVTGQYSWLNGIRASGGGESISPGGSGFAISLEGGKTLNRDKSLLIEPQAQLIYSHTNIDDDTLDAGPSRPFATPIRFSNLNSVTGRLGVLFQKNPDSGDNFLPWARVNLWHTFSGSSRMSSPGLDDIETSMNGTSAELTAGFNLLGSKDSKWAIDVSAGYLFNLSGAKNTGWRGNLGARYNF
jgi:outer membrane autotransporter protein